jgi:hypothetical protein
MAASARDYLQSLTELSESSERRLIVERRRGHRKRIPTPNTLATAWR